jgi:hypothetical protein
MEESTPHPEGTPEEGSVRDRRCGRCQVTFAGDPDSHAAAQLGWWLCPPCREALVGHQTPGRW